MTSPIHLSRKGPFFLILALLCVTNQTIGLAQNNTDIVGEIQQAYVNLKYDEAKNRAEAALASFQNLSPSQLTEIHKFLGLIYYSRNMTPEARNHFETAVSITPQLELDPIFVSPKIIEFFSQVKKDFFTKQQKQDDVASSRYVFVYDPRPSAAVRCMVLPGWGQLYKGEKTKGYVLMALWTVGVVGSVTTHLIRENAEDAYLGETDPAEIERRFEKFDTYHKLRNNLMIFSAGVWLYSYFDAMLYRAPEQSGFRFVPEVTPAISRLNISFSF